MFGNLELAKKQLLDINYYHLISCSKVRFAQSVNHEKKYVYSASNFDDWNEYFQKDVLVSEYLAKLMLSFERKINSRLANYISNGMEKNQFNNHEKNEILRRIRRSRYSMDLETNNHERNQHDGSYRGKETWRFVAKMTLGEIKGLLFWLFENKHELYQQVVTGYQGLTFPKSEITKFKEKLDNIQELRNSLFHFRPLTIYLIYGKGNNDKFNNKNRKKTVQWLFAQRYNDLVNPELNVLLDCTDRFMKIKKQPTMLTEKKSHSYKQIVFSQSPSKQITH